VKEILVPANGHVLVEVPSDKKNGMYIPDDIKDSVQMGVVLAVAPDVDIQISVENKSRKIRVGDLLRWEKYAEADGIFDHGKQKVCLVKAKQIMGVYPNKINGFYA
jgi:co-chaperonin GroES (HSP10)